MTKLSTAMLALAILVSVEGIERRRPLYRRGFTTTTVSSLTHDSEGSESKLKSHGKDLFTVGDSNPVGSSIGGSSSGSIKLDGDKVTSFSEYKFGSSKLSSSSSDVGILDGTGIDDENVFTSFKNHKKASPLPATNASNKDRKTHTGSFDFLNGDYAKSKLSAGNGHLIDSTSGIGQGSKTKTSAISSMFSISHPTPNTSKAAVKVSHLDDSTEYDVYSNIEHASAKTKLVATGKHRTSPTSFSLASGSSLSFDGKIQKTPFKYEEGGLAALAGKSKHKSKLSLDEDSFGSGTLASTSNTFSGLGSYNSGGYNVGGKHQQGVPNASKSKFNFAEPPPLVKSTLNTLKHFGEGLIGNVNGAVRAPYDLESKENYKIGSLFGKGYYEPEESYENSAEPALSIGKFPGSAGASGIGTPNVGSKFVTDFDVKNIKFASDGDKFSNIGHKFSGTLTKNTTPHYKYPQSTHHQQHHQQQQPFTHPVQAQTHFHANTLGNPGSIDNPNPLDFRPKFKLQDVPNLYPADHLGAGIAAKGQIENFLNSEHVLKDETLVKHQLSDGNAAGHPSHHQVLKSQDDEKLEKEALRQQIEYLKLQASKRPLEHTNPNRPAIVSNAQKFRPLRRIPSHVRLGVKAPYPLPRIPHYNDRPYSISFKI